MEFQLDQAIEILRQTPATLRSMLNGLSDEWIKANEGPDSWSPFDIVGHLIHGEETDWLPRLKIILEHGEARPFTPFDRFAQFEKSAGKTLEEISAATPMIAEGVRNSLAIARLAERRGVEMPITEEMVRGMQPGAIIVDLAAEGGGNCQLTRPGETVTVHGVTILGPVNLASTIPYHASQMYAKNVTSFLQNAVTDGELRLNLEDEIIRDTLLTHEGEVVNPKVRELLGMPASST